MDARTNRVAVLANSAVYSAGATHEYIDGAPHIKHASLRRLYASLAVSVYDFAAVWAPTPEVLDLGAGEGSVTLPFLELGANVTAIDIADAQLVALQAKCLPYAGQLTLRCQNVDEAIASLLKEGKRYDVVVANSFLHHVPDYLGLIRRAIPALSSHGQFFSFQDPLRYDSLGRSAMLFSTLVYGSWRIFKGDIIEGIRRRVRRGRGIYIDTCPADNVEYHVVRNGVDQDAIAQLFRHSGFECEIVRYFSTQSRIWQPIGTALGVRNIFAVVARRSETNRRLAARRTGR